MAPGHRTLGLTGILKSDMPHGKEVIHCHPFTAYDNHTRQCNSPPTIAIVAPKHHPNSVPPILFPIFTSLSSWNSYPNLNNACIKVRSKHHSGRSSNSFIRSASLPQSLADHVWRPLQISWAVEAMVDTVIGLLGGRRGARRS